MSWDARQRAMLEAMGLKVWTPLPPVADASAADGDSSARAMPAVPAAPEAEAPIVLRAAAAKAHSPAPEVAPASPPAAVSARPVGEVLRTLVPAPAPAPAPAVAPASVQTDPERAARILQMDWPALRESVAQCQACTLCEGRKNTVFGVGHESAHWMIVGEAPGEQEDLRGEPFVGPAGQLLDNMLRAVQRTRQTAEAPQQVFIANTLKCRPPRNRNPDAAELAQCRPYLQRQIELVKPRIILAMGRFAVQTLLGSQEAIGKLRGRVHRYQGIPVIVTYHPAYLLRNLQDKARAWEDLCLAWDCDEQAQASADAQGTPP